MKHNTFTWQAKDGLALLAQVWKPENEIKAVINLVHGMGEHSGRYANWAKRFVEKNIAVVSFDHRGHGQSEGKRGDSTSYNNFMDDIELLLQKSAEMFPGKAQFLYGHSLGGNLALNFALRRKPELNGLIATSPWLELAEPPSKLLFGFAKVMKKILPSLSQNTNLNRKYISRDAKEVESYATDKYVHSKITIRMFIGVVENGLWALQNAQNLENKLLIHHGTGDKITSHKASEEFFEKVPGNKEIKLWEGAYHELHHEYQRQELFDSTLDWILRGCDEIN